MTSLLDGELAGIISDAAGFLFLEAILTRDVRGVGSDPADPPAPTQISYPCLAIEDQISSTLMASGLVAAGEAVILILANSLAVTPKSLDRISITSRGKTWTIVAEANSGSSTTGTRGRQAVVGDPARATWSCRCRT